MSIRCLLLLRVFDDIAIMTVEGFEDLHNLRCLFLSKNLVSGIGTGLSSLKQLVMLDLSYNRITHLSGLSDCPSLQSLNVSKNSLQSAESISHLMECKNLHTIDITHNLLEEKENVMDILQNIHSLSTLSITGNEVGKKVHYFFYYYFFF